MLVGMLEDTCDGVRDAYLAACPCRELLDLLANKWSALALGALEDGPRRFGALRAKLDGISPKMLTQTLRRLEELGLVDRVVYPAVPLHVEYSLTPLGRSLSGRIAAIREWAYANMGDIEAARRDFDAPGLEHP